MISNSKSFLEGFDLVKENHPPLVIACGLNTSGMLASLGVVF